MSAHLYAVVLIAAAAAAVAIIAPKIGTKPVHTTAN